MRFGHDRSTDNISIHSKREIEAALQALFDNIEEDPNIIENYINAGIVLADANEIEKAERFFQKALTIDSQNGIVFTI